MVVERDSVAYEWEKYRLLNEIVNDMPEMAFDPSNGGFNGVANRSQITNLFSHSIELEDSVWSKFGVGVEDNAEISPMGLMNASKITGGGTASRMQRSFSLDDNTDYMLSFFAKKGTHDLIGFRFYDKNGDIVNHTREINLTNGTLETEVGAIASTIQEVGNEWYLIKTYFNSGLGSQTPRIRIFDYVGGGGFPTGSYYFAFNIQLNKASEGFTPVISDPTIATRLADDIENIPVPMGATEIRAFVDGVETIIDSNLPATWEFPENSTTKYVIIK